MPSLSRSTRILVKCCGRCTWNANTVTACWDQNTIHTHGMRQSSCASSPPFLVTLGRPRPLQPLILTFSNHDCPSTGGWTSRRRKTNPRGKQQRLTIVSETHCMQVALITSLTISMLALSPLWCVIRKTYMFTYAAYSRNERRSKFCCAFWAKAALMRLRAPWSEISEDNNYLFR